MRVPIQREGSGRLSITIDFEQTPPGFEDAFESSLFYRRYSRGQALGEYNAPDVTALTGNPTAQLVRLRSIEENRIAFTLRHIGQYHGRYLQMEVYPYGPCGNTLRDTVSKNEPCYVTFRIETKEDEEGNTVVHQINGADFTTI